MRLFFFFSPIKTPASYLSTSLPWIISYEEMQTKQNLTIAKCYREWKLFGDYGWQDLTM